MDIIFLVLPIYVLFVFYFIIFRCCFKTSKNSNLFFYEIDRHCLRIKEVSWWSVFKYLFSSIYILYFILSPITNFFRCFTTQFYIRLRGKLYTYNNQSNKRFFSCIIELIVIGQLAFWMIIFWIESSCKILTFFALWRIASIIINKLQEITFLNITKSFESFTRTVFLTLFNFFELLFIYAYLYTFSSFKISMLFKGGWTSIRETFYIFVNWNISNSEYSWSLYPQQEALIFIQTISFIIIIIVFFGNITGIKSRNR